MNSLTAILVGSLCLSIAYAFDATHSLDQGRAKAIRECNASIPVQRNPREVIDEGLSSGNKITLSQQEKCFLRCHLQKIGILDENSNLLNGLALVDELLDGRKGTDLAKYSDIYVSQIFHIIALTKTIEEKCQKAYVIYRQIIEGISMVRVAQVLEGTPSLKRKIFNDIETGQVVGGLEKIFSHFEEAEKSRRLANL